MIDFGVVKPSKSKADPRTSILVAFLAPTFYLAVMVVVLPLTKTSFAFCSYNYRAYPNTARFGQLILVLK
jgi:hypothetical protein